MFLIFGAISLFAQEHHIDGTIAGFDNVNVYLMQLTIDSQKVIDTTQSNANGSFHFDLKPDVPDGMYRVFSHRKMLDLIYHHENIRFVANGNNNNDKVQIIESVENMLYYNYLFVKTDNQEKLGLLQPVLAQYPKNDSFYTVLRHEVEKLQTGIERTANDIIKNYPNTLVAHYVKVDKPPLFNLDLPPKQQREQLKKIYFNNVDFADSTLLTSNVLTKKIVGYLALYQSPDMKKDQLQDAFITAIDTVLNKSMVYDKVYESVLDYLVGGFENYGFEKVLQHLAEYNRLDDFCENSAKKEALKYKLDLINTLAIGKPAPHFRTEDLDGKMIDLDSIKAEKTLLVFWASWCPHCTQTLPTLKKYYDPDNTQKLQIIAISIDEDKKDVEQAIHDKKYPWINIAELKGWDGPIVEQYGVVATPTFFLLDKNKKIIAKPVSPDELTKILEE